MSYSQDWSGIDSIRIYLQKLCLIQPRIIIIIPLFPTITLLVHVVIIRDLRSK